jgi:hypothetical protein
MASNCVKNKQKEAQLKITVCYLSYAKKSSKRRLPENV